MITNPRKTRFEQLPNEVFNELLEFSGASMLPTLLGLNKNISNNIKLGECTKPFIKNHDILLLDKLQMLLEKNAYHPHKGISLPMMKVGLSLSIVLLQLGILILSGFYIDKGRIADNASYNECMREFHNSGCICDGPRIPEIIGNWCKPYSSYFTKFCTYPDFNPSNLLCGNENNYENATLLWYEAKTNYTIGFPTLFLGSFVTIGLFIIYNFLLLILNMSRIVGLSGNFDLSVYDIYGFCSYDSKKSLVKIDSTSCAILNRLQHYNTLNTIKADKDLATCTTTIDTLKTEIKNHIKQLKPNARLSLFAVKKEPVRDVGLAEKVTIEL